MHQGDDREDQVEKVDQHHEAQVDEESGTEADAPDQGTDKPGNQADVDHGNGDLGEQ